MTFRLTILLLALALCLCGGCKTNPNNWIEQGGSPLVLIWQDTTP